MGDEAIQTRGERVESLADVNIEIAQVSAGRQRA